MSGALANYLTISQDILYVIESSWSPVKEPHLLSGMSLPVLAHTHNEIKHTQMVMASLSCPH